MKIIVGLGNPGKEYANTRHNVGFLFVDSLKEKLDLPEFKPDKHFDALITDGVMNGEKILVAKPQTFMNLSGEAVQKLVNFYHVEPQNLWVVYDDVDLAIGTMRIRKEGSAGTHNGMKSIIEHLGFQNFPRLRIGIESRGEMAPNEQDLSSFVLHPFSKEEMPLVQKVIEEGIQSLILS